MRISKVKVNKRDVVVKRDAQGGYLLWGDETQKQGQIAVFLQREKRQSFALSVLNKTLVREVGRKPARNAPDREQKQWKNDQSNHQTLTRIFEKALDPKKEFHRPPDLRYLKKLTANDLKKHLSHKFKEDFTYRPAPGAAPVTVDLAAELYTALNTASDAAAVAEKLTGYKKWAAWYIQRKQTLLARSIANNRLPLTDADHAAVTSRRKQALRQLADAFVQGTDAFDSLKDAFGLDALCAHWQACWRDEPKITAQDSAHSRHRTPRPPKPETVGLPVDSFEFKRRLKKILQTHQSALFKDGRNDTNHTLSLFSQETARYLALYFPLKKSGKRLSVDDISYYLRTDTVRDRLRDRIANLTTQFQLQRGKVAFRDLAAHPAIANPSDLLQQVKIADVFALKFIDACAFAANNLRNGIDRTQEHDILTRDKSLNSLEKLDTSSAADDAAYRLRAFFGTVPHTPNDLKNFIWATRGAIQAIRNQVVHFDQEFRVGTAQKLYQEILSVTHYEVAQRIGKDVLSNSVPFASAPQADVLRQELDQLPALFAETLRSAGLFDFYEPTKIRAVCQGVSLFNRPLSFIPAFATVFAHGATYQHKATYPLGTACYVKKGDTDDAEYQARRNALRLVYEYRFIPDFLNDPNLFGKTVQKVLDTNRDYAKQTANGNRQKERCWAFQEVAAFDTWCKATRNNSSSPITAYLQDIHSQLILEENKKRKEYEESGQTQGLAPDETGHFQKFLRDVFIKGFDTYLNNRDSDFGFIATPQDRLAHLPTEGQKAAARNACVANFDAPIGHTIDPTQGGPVAFWTLCKMLDSPHLNELGNQFSKMRQAEEKGMANTGQSAHVDVLQQIVRLCLLTADHTPADYRTRYATQQQCLAALEPYVDGAILTDAPYTQEDGTPVMFGPVELVKKYATENILAPVLQKYRVDGQTVADWRTQKEQAADWALHRQRLHDAWVQAKTNRQDRAWLADYGTTYLDYCQKLDAYNWLDNMVNLVHVRTLHHLLVTILGRMMGFVALWERDFHYFNEALNKQIGGTPLSIIDKKSNNLTIHNFLESRKDLLYARFLDDAGTKRPNTQPDLSGRTWKEKRNNIAHLAYLSTGAKGASLLDLLFDVRALLSYDRKLKNAVAKAFIDLLDRHGIVITFEPLHRNDHRFVIENITAKTITHLGGGKITHPGQRTPAPITTPAHPQKYVDMVRDLLQFRT